MLELLLVLVVFSLAFGLIIWGAAWTMSRAVERSVGSKHRDLEEIVNTGRVPRGWTEPVERKIAGLGDDPTSVEKAASMRDRAATRHLRRLDGLARYTRTTTLVDGEDTRAELLDRLAVARDGVQRREDLGPARGDDNAEEPEQ